MPIRELTIVRAFVYPDKTRGSPPLDIGIFNIGELARRVAADPRWWGDHCETGFEGRIMSMNSQCWTVPAISLVVEDRGDSDELPDANTAWFYRPGESADRVQVWPHA